MDDLYRSTEKDLNEIAKIDSGDHHSFPRFVVWGVVLFSGLAVLALYMHIQSNLSLEIPQIGNQSVTDIEVDTSLSLLELEDEQLRSQDSDRDGLSDYDELRVYGTSAFIADTDSDGLSDKAEIEAGKDPNCPEGQDCFGAVDPLQQEETSSPFVTPEIEAITQDPAAIKQLLIDQGVNPLLVNQLDDQTLQVLAKEAFDALSNPTPEKIELLENLTPDEIRTVLQFGGAEKQALDQLSDEELQELYSQSLSIHSGGLSTDN